MCSPIEYRVLWVNTSQWITIGLVVSVQSAAVSNTHTHTHTHTPHTHTHTNVTQTDTENTKCPTPVAVGCIYVKKVAHTRLLSVGFQS